MEYKVYYTNKSRKMLNSHISFLSRVSLNASTKLKCTFEEYINTLKVFPKIGSKVDFNGKLPSKYRKMVISKRYILIYIVSQNYIYIETILDSRQNNKY